jgi:hypothetical protein
MCRAFFFVSIVVLSASQAFAIGNPPPPPAPPGVLQIFNNCDGAVEVSVDGSAPFVMEPLGQATYGYDGGKRSLKVTVSATLVGTSLRAAKSFTLQSGKTVVATIATNAAGTRLTISAAGAGKLALNRESAVVLASSGGLLPLLLLGWLLGGAPRRGGLAGVRTGRDFPFRWARLGTLASALVILGLMAGRAWALPGEGPGGGNPKQQATLRVVNQADAPVEVSVSNSKATLEPGGVHTVIVDVKGKGEVGMHAKLAGPPGVGDHEKCPVQSFLTTTATITSDGTALSITCLAPGFAMLSRESGVILASSSCLLSLLWLGCRLGRAPRLRADCVA